MDSHSSPERKISLGRGWRVSRRIFFTLLVVAVLLVAARSALPYVLREAINRRLAAIPEYTGQVERVGVSLWRGAYTLHAMEILKRNGEVKEPFFRADEIDFSLAWRELFRGKFVSDIVLRKPMLVFVEAKLDEATQLPADRRWQDAINDIFPIDITFLKISDGDLRYINQGSKPKVDVRIAHLEGIATGLRNRTDDKEQEFPASIAMRGETIGGGILKLSTQLEPLAVEPHFLLKLEIEQVAMPALNDFLRAYGGIDVRAGTFTGYVEMTAKDGRFGGYFKPFFENVDFSTPPGEERPLRQQIWESLVRGFAWVFKNHAKDQVATRIPFSGEFKNLNVRKWESFVNLVKHAFVEPLKMKLDSRAGLGADEKAADGTAKSEAAEPAKKNSAARPPK